MTSHIGTPRRGMTLLVAAVAAAAAVALAVLLGVDSAAANATTSAAVPTNPGVYVPYRQQAFWPFLPALGAVIAFAALIAAIVLAVGLRKREQPAIRALIAVVVAVAVGWPSGVGLVAAAGDWADHNAVARAAYVDTVRGWLGSQGYTVTNAEVASLLDRADVVVQTSAGVARLTIHADRAQNLLDISVAKGVGVSTGS